jgi:signal transduction histidine kinase
VRVALVVPRHLPRWPQDVETAVFRIVQESLSNVQRHSGSRRARVRLRSQGRLLMAEVTDWGRGFDPAKQQSGRVSLGVGLRGMRERVRQLGGELAITSGAGGTTIRVRIPRPAPHLLRLPA